MVTAVGRCRTRGSLSVGFTLHSVTAQPAAVAGRRPARVGAVETVPAVDVDGVAFSALTEVEVAEHVMASMRAGRGGTVLTPNIDILRKLRHPDNVDLVDRAELVVADGAPVVWASHLLRAPLPERVTGSSLISTLAKAAAGERRSIYLLGGKPGVAEKGARCLALVPGLVIAGHLCPEWGFDHDPVQVAEIVSTVRAARPDLVYVGLGFPKQERLIAELRTALPSAWFLGCGGGLAFLAGEVSRAPRWMQAAGLEWLHRMAKDPRRLARRYLIDDVPYAIALLSRSARQGRRRASAGTSLGDRHERRADDAE